MAVDQHSYAARPPQGEPRRHSMQPNFGEGMHPGQLAVCGHDMNLWAGLDPEDDLADVADKAQRSINCWGKLLVATGGALKPEECKWMVHDMVPRADGT